MNDLTERTFGRWTVLGIAGEFYPPRWRCRCQCGNEKIVHSHSLVNGSSQSCGCLRMERLKTGAYLYIKHKHEYYCWTAMRTRCLNPKSKDYARYGAKGISVASAWNSFERFIADMGPAPTSSHQIDRIRNSEGYSADNCRWATRQEQCRNRTSNRLVTVGGETKPLQAWCDQYGIFKHTVRYRLSKGWEPLSALTTPPHGKA